MSQSEVINIIHSFVTLLRDSGVKIDRAFLYGSFATNNASEDSDIDVLLVSDIFDTEDDATLS
jgi:predicted nucleotidyltransferase